LIMGALKVRPGGWMGCRTLLVTLPKHSLFVMGDPGEL